MILNNYNYDHLDLFMPSLQVYLGVITLLAACQLMHGPNTLGLSSVKLRGLFLRSLLNHKAVEECSFRPVLFQLIIKLLFSTVCFLLRKLWGFDSLSCCLLTQKGSSNDSCCLCESGRWVLCEGVVVNRIRTDRCMAVRSVNQCFTFLFQMTIMMANVNILPWKMKQTCGCYCTWK